MNGRVARALVLESPRHLVGREFLLPEPEGEAAVLAVEACGLCGTDHEQWSGALWGGRPFVPGHETIGVIEALGPQAAQRWGVAVGDRVAVEVFRACGTCAACRARRSRQCVEHGLADMYGFAPADTAPGAWGGYGERQWLGAGTRVLRVPDGLDPVVATLFNPLGAGIRWGARLPGTAPGDVVAVLGPGVRGLAATAAARDAGAAFVLVTGRGPRDAARLALAPRFGATLAVDVAREDPVAALRSQTGRLADVVVDVTANAPEAFAQALALARPGGTVVVAGMRGASAGAPGFEPDRLVAKELRVLGALGVETEDYRAALELLASHRWPFAELPRAVVGLDRVDGLLAAMAGESDELPPTHAVVVPARSGPGSS